MMWKPLLKTTDLGLMEALMRYINSLKWDVKFPINISIFLGKGAIPSTKSSSQGHSEVTNHSLKLMAMVVLQGPFYSNSQFPIFI